ncbi:MAG: hypothetical protein QXZ31_08310 [Thermofilaceae archaeon]
MERLVGEVLGWLLERTERNVASITPRRLRKIARRSARRLSAAEVKKLMDEVLEEVSKEREVFVKRKNNGVRVAFILPRGVENPYLEA